MARLPQKGPLTYLCSMQILLDCRPLQQEGADSEKTRLIFLIAGDLARDKGVRWLLLFDSRLSFSAPDWPGTLLIPRRALPGSLGEKYWYRRQVPRAARKYGAEGIALTGDVRQVPSPLPQYHWTPTAFPDEEMLPLPATEKESRKLRYAGGKEYFLVSVDGMGQAGITNLLKAFSLFKKRQLSNMHLVMTGRTDQPGKRLQELLDTYKYRQEVHWYDHKKEWIQLTGAAYACIWPASVSLQAKGAAIGMPIVNAWQARVPMVISAAGFFPEMAGDAALLTDMEDPAALAAALMRLYKDEVFREDLIRKGTARSDLFSRDRSVETVWRSIQ